MARFPKPNYEAALASALNSLDDEYAIVGAKEPMFGGFLSGA
jgi:hypothetical protein